MKKNKSAFTLIELMVTMAIITILLGLIWFGISMVQQAQRDAERKAKLKDINFQVQRYINLYKINPSLTLTQGSAIIWVGTASCNVASASCFRVDTPGYLVNRLSSTNRGTLWGNLSTACTVGTGYKITATLESGEIYILGTCK